MLKFTVNIGMLFPELTFLDRFEACRLSGFKFVEFPFPYAFDPLSLNDYIRKAGLELILFDLPVDDWDSGGRGCATDPFAVDTFREGLERAIRYATVLRPKYLTCIVGNRLSGIPYSTQRDVLIDNMRYASDMVFSMGIDLLVEIFNNYDNPDFFLTRVSDAIALVNEVNKPNFKIQIDTYHVQKMEGDLIPIFRRHINNIGHIQIGDVPGRHQPGTGLIDFTLLFGELEQLDYQGYIGLEYKPLGNTRDSLNWLKKFDQISISSGSKSLNGCRNCGKE